MKKIIFLIFASVLFGISINAQSDASKTTTAQTESKPKKKSFRSTKDQVMQAQKMLKVTESGKMDAETKAAVKTFQGENGLRKSGSLNRATLEKMNITLTDAQKEIPVSPNSFVTAKTEKSSEKKPRGAVFRASKEQIMQAQKMMKEKGMYGGEETGKLDDATREGLKKFQEANGVKSTGTLNRATLEKMGIALTDKQKEM
ncbi:MAG: peptidoglycan-binding domain-containing protein [Pyrinomonadaceae bacterium]